MADQILHVQHRHDLQVGDGGSRSLDASCSLIRTSEKVSRTEYKASWNSCRRNPAHRGGGLLHTGKTAGCLARLSGRIIPHERASHGVVEYRSRRKVIFAENGCGIRGDGDRLAGFLFLFSVFCFGAPANGENEGGRYRRYMWQEEEEVGWGGYRSLNKVRPESIDLAECCRI